MAEEEDSNFLLDSLLLDGKLSIDAVRNLTMDGRKDWAGDDEYLNMYKLGVKTRQRYGPWKRGWGASIDAVREKARNALIGSKASLKYQDAFDRGYQAAHSCIITDRSFGGDWYTRSKTHVIGEMEDDHIRGSLRMLQRTASIKHFVQVKLALSDVPFPASKRSSALWLENLANRSEETWRAYVESPFNQLERQAQLRNIRWWDYPEPIKITFEFCRSVLKDKRKPGISKVEAGKLDKKLAKANRVSYLRCARCHREFRCERPRRNGKGDATIQEELAKQCPQHVYEYVNDGLSVDSPALPIRTMTTKKLTEMISALGA